MKATGVVRKIDELGRIVLPMEIRKAMEIAEKDALEIFTEDGRIILQKYSPSCIFCPTSDNLVSYNDKKICASCLAKLKTL